MKENRLRELRRERGITQAKMADSLGVALSTVQNWESDRTEMTGHTLIMVADYLGVTPNEVYGSGTPDKDVVDERNLLALFRSCSSHGQERILEYAGMVSKEHPKR